MRTKTVYLTGLNGLSGEKALLMTPVNQVPIEQRRGIIALHGRGADATVWTPGWAGARHAQVLADAGYYVLSIDAGGGYTFNNIAAMTAITNAYNYLIGTIGLAETKIGLFGWSMGGGNSLQWIKENPTKVWAALLWCPLSDLDYHAGYPPTPSAEAEAAYSPPIYPSGSYVTNSVGHKIADEYATWRDKCPIRIIQGTADTSVPLSKSQAFIDGVNQPQVDMVTLAGSDHTTLFQNYDVTNTLEFFRSNQEDLGVYVPNPLKLLAPESTKFQDSARTIAAAANNDPIGSWTDIALDQHMVQATAGKRPLLKKNVLNNYDVVEFDGIDDYMEAAMVVKSSSTLFVVAKKMNGVTGRVLAGFKVGSSRVIIYDSTVSGYAWFAKEDLTTQELGGPTPQQWNILCLRVNSGASMEYRANGGPSLATFDPNDTVIAANVLMLGANNNSAGTYGAYQVAECIRYDGALTLDQINFVGAGLATKFALPWTEAS